MRKQIILTHVDIYLLSSVHLYCELHTSTVHYCPSLSTTHIRLVIIKPIPKGSSIDPKLPMQYRGISLLSTVYKLYTAVLNDRLLKFSERNIYCDEQNGFRPNRSCTDHIYILSSILRHRIHQNLSTYACFIDAEKAFDRVDRNLMLYKLFRYGFKEIYIIT